MNLAIEDPLASILEAVHNESRLCRVIDMLRRCEKAEGDAKPREFPNRAMYSLESCRHAVWAYETDLLQPEVRVLLRRSLGNEATDRRRRARHGQPRNRVRRLVRIVR